MLKPGYLEIDSFFFLLFLLFSVFIFPMILKTFKWEDLFGWVIIGNYMVKSLKNEEKTQCCLQRIMYSLLMSLTYIVRICKSCIGNERSLGLHSYLLNLYVL